MQILKLMGVVPPATMAMTRSSSLADRPARADRDSANNGDDDSRDDGRNGGHGVRQDSGGVSRSESTAYPARHAPHNLNVNGVWRPEEAAELAEPDTDWVRRFFAALEPYREGVYVNFLDSDDGTSRVREAYGDRYDRLVELKTRWDPENVLRINQNIEPAKDRGLKDGDPP